MGLRMIPFIKAKGGRVNTGYGVTMSSSGDSGGDTPIPSTTGIQYKLNEEVETNQTWVDGKKIYAYTVSGNTQSGNYPATNITSAINIDTFIGATGEILTLANEKVNVLGSNGSYNLGVVYSGGMFKFIHTTNYTNCPYKIIVYYTK